MRIEKYAEADQSWTKSFVEKGYMEVLKSFTDAGDLSGRGG